MDLSKVPDLELRQKVKALTEQSEALGEEIDREVDRVTGALREKRNAIEKQIESLLGNRYIDGRCDVSGLPIFDTDDIVSEHTTMLACLAEAEEKAAA